MLWPGSGNTAVARAGGIVSVNQVQPTDHLITACNEGPEENEWEAVMENALGPS